MNNFGSLHRSLRASRRDFLQRSACGFGAMALAGLLGCEQSSQPAPRSSTAGKRPKARQVIYLYMSGAPSHLDTFDYKPLLKQEHGQPIKIQVPDVQFNAGGHVMQSPFRFAQHGASGAWMSEIFPNLARHADQMCFIKSMVADHGEHGTGNVFMNTGSGRAGRPSMGAWLTYGLGSDSKELPGYIVLDSGRIPIGGAACYSNGFLPAVHQATVFHEGKYPVADLARQEPTAELQAAKVALAQRQNRDFARAWAGHSQLEAVIQSAELAFAMQTAVPELVDLSGESQATRQLYGIDEYDTDRFGRQCLLARRLIERGVRFVQLFPPKLDQYDQWDQHFYLEQGHRANATAIDKPIAGLLADLQARGLLDETLVLWGGEFGRTPMVHVNPAGVVSATGRTHNRFGFTVWMAGGGVKPGFTYGGTDEYGVFAEPEKKVTVHDLHATILHLLGIDHTQLTYRHGGRDYRLTDVFGEVVHDVVG
ncbi:MAG: DUF1501 domain-containing protein [Pirellulales bacterium]|nr:DUF1501 domain-containing protein [Pirellulales bacterium]